MAKVLDTGLEFSEFELESHYYFHFQSDTLGKNMNSHIPPAMG